MKHLKNRYKIYIAGKVTGLDYDETFKKFKEVEDMLNLLGHETVNPMRIVPKGTSWADAMLICIQELSACNSIYLLPDFKESKGAMYKYRLANKFRYKLANDLIVDTIKKTVKKAEKITLKITASPYLISQFVDFLPIDLIEKISADQKCSEDARRVHKYLQINSEKLSDLVEINQDLKGGAR